MRAGARKGNAAAGAAAAGVTPAAALPLPLSGGVELLPPCPSSLIPPPRRWLVRAGDKLNLQYPRWQWERCLDAKK